MSEHLIQGFFKQPYNQKMVNDILKDYQLSYNNYDKKFMKYLLYEIVSLISDHPHSITSILKNESQQHSLLFDNVVFSDIKQKLDEETKFLDNPVTVEDGVVECKKCKSLKTISFAKQTRGSDEGTSVFVTCVMCQYKFRL